MEEKIDEIVSIPKGSRLGPSTYIEKTKGN